MRVSVGASFYPLFFMRAWGQVFHPGQIVVLGDVGSLDQHAAVAAAGPDEAKAVMGSAYQGEQGSGGGDGPAGWRRCSRAARSRMFRLPGVRPAGEEPVHGPPGVGSPRVALAICCRCR
jgi:hypothetical protein